GARGGCARNGGDEAGDGLGEEVPVRGAGGQVFGDAEPGDGEPLGEGAHRGGERGGGEAAALGVEDVEVDVEVDGLGAGGGGRAGRPGRIGEVGDGEVPEPVAVDVVDLAGVERAGPGED